MRVEVKQLGMPAGNQGKQNGSGRVEEASDKCSERG